MEREADLPVVSFFDDKKAKQKQQQILDKRQKKRKQADAYRVQNTAPVGAPVPKSIVKDAKSPISATKKRKLSEDSAEELADENFETMQPGSHSELLPFSSVTFAQFPSMLAGFSFFANFVFVCSRSKIAY